MRCLPIIFCAVLVLFSLQQAQAKIIHVPADSSTIQGGINGAASGDTVLVAADTYNEHINFKGKAILVTSEAGAESTIIDKVSDGLSIVTFNSGEDTTSVLEGFTVTGGQSVNLGSGIHCVNSSPKIRNNIIAGNSAIDKGSGLRCQGGHPVLEANLIENNFGTAGGAGMHIYQCDASVRDNVIRENISSYEHGGGVFLQECDGTTLERNLIVSCSANDLGGGIIVSGGSNNILRNNTIVNNDAAAGGGVCIYYTDSPTLLNNIIVGSPGGYGIYSSNSTNCIIEYNDVWDNLPANYQGVAPGEGCISADPMFCDPESDDYSLHINSPCLGTGQAGVNMGAFGLGCGSLDISSGPDQTGPANSEVSISFYVQNNEDFTDTFDLTISDSLGWDIVPPSYELTLDAGQTDTAHFTVGIPYVPLGTMDEVILLGVSRGNPLGRDSAALTVTCNAYVEGWEITSGPDVSGGSNSLVSATFHIQNTGPAPDSCNVIVSDSLGWDIQPTNYQLTLDPGQQDSVFFDVSIPSVPLGITDKLTLSGVSLSNPFVIDSASLFIICDSYNVTVTEISDVGNDQGKQVQIDWLSFPGSDPLVTHFTIFRREDSLLFVSIIAKSEVFSSKDYPPGNWIMIDTYPAYGETLYSVIVPTLKDSTIVEGMYWSVFFIRAGTDDPTIYFDSPIDSGYSLDNLSPSPPSGLLASHEPAITKLTWSKCVDLDFDYYTLYRDTTSEFEPSLDNRLAFTIDTAFVDSTAELGEPYYYVASATDFSGNESDPSNEVTGVRYIAGDANTDGTIDVGDIVFLVNYLLLGAYGPNPLEAGDADCNGEVDVGDIIYLANYVLLGGMPPGC